MPKSKPAKHPIHQPGPSKLPPKLWVNLVLHGQLEVAGNPTRIANLHSKGQTYWVDMVLSRNGPPRMGRFSLVSCIEYPNYRQRVLDTHPTSDPQSTDFASRTDPLCLNISGTPPSEGPKTPRGSSLGRKRPSHGWTQHLCASSGQVPRQRCRSSTRERCTAAETSETLGVRWAKETPKRPQRLPGPDRPSNLRLGVCNPKVHQSSFPRNRAPFCRPQGSPR